MSISPEESEDHDESEVPSGWDKYRNFIRPLEVWKVVLILWGMGKIVELEVAVTLV